MRTTSLDEILGDFSPAAPENCPSTRNGATVTIWVPAEMKARYDRLQEKSGRRFSKKARETLIALIAMAEAKVG